MLLYYNVLHYFVFRRACNTGVGGNKHLLACVSYLWCWWHFVLFSLQGGSSYLAGSAFSCCSKRAMPFSVTREEWCACSTALSIRGEDVRQLIQALKMCMGYSSSSDACLWCCTTSPCFNTVLVLDIWPNSPVCNVVEFFRSLILSVRWKTKGS